MPRDKATYLMNQTKALELRIAGLSYQQIAKIIGWKAHTSAQRAVIGALEANRVEPCERLRHIEVLRLDRMLQDFVKLEASDDPTKPGPLEIMAMKLRIMERRARLQGLDEPQKHEVAGSAGGAPVKLEVVYVNDWRGGTDGEDLPAASDGAPTPHPAK